MQRSLLEAIAERVLLADGAMGTQQQRVGLEPGGSGEAWNVANPDAVLTIQRGYVEAGSDCLLSNTFGACRIMLERHSLADRVEEINARGVALARAAFAGRQGYVIGDIGPFGGLMEPYGEVPQEAVAAAFREQAAALVRAGADAVIIETQTALEEIGLGIAAAREAGAACIIASMAFGPEPRRQGRPHHDGGPGGAGGRSVAGGRRRHSGHQLRHRGGHDVGRPDP